MKRFRMDSNNEGPDLFHVNEVTNIDKEASVLQDLSLPIINDVAITESQHNRMAENKRIAEEKRKSRLLANIDEPQNLIFTDVSYSFDS